MFDPIDKAYAAAPHYVFERFAWWDERSPEANLKLHADAFIVADIPYHLQSFSFLPGGSAILAVFKKGI